jgi:hypothetical protein
MPPDVGIPGGSIPIPTPPPVWSGPWSDPHPTSTSTTTSDEPDPTCPVSVPNVAYNWATDPENADWDNEGTDPDMRKRDDLNATSVLFRRTDPRRKYFPQVTRQQTLRLA